MAGVEVNGLRPYPDYKDSGVAWLGEVPEHWEVKPGFASFTLKQSKNTGLIESTVLSLSYGRLVVKPVDKLHGLVPKSFETYQIVDPDDIIIRPTDLQNDWNSLRVGLAKHRGIITSAYLCLKPRQTILPEYCYLILHSYDLMKVYYGMGSGLRQNLDFVDFKRLPVLIPPGDEQQKIVAYVEWLNHEVNRFIRNKQQLIATLNAQKQAIIQQAMTRGLDPNVRLKPSGVAWLGDVPEHWEVMPLKQALLSMEYGISASATDDGTIRLLTMGHVKDGKVIIPKHGGVNRVDKRLLIAKGDLLFNRTNSAELVGKVGLVTDTPGCETTFASYLVRLKTKGGIDPVYLNYLLNSSSILGIARQMAIPSLHQSNLNPTRYGRVQIALPPYDEQKHIVVNLAAECKNLDLAITHAQTQIALMRDYRTHLIADVVTGKLDVRAAAAQLPLEPLAPGAVQNDLPDSLEGDEDLTDDPTTEASEGETSDE